MVFDLECHLAEARCKFQKNAYQNFASGTIVRLVFVKFKTKTSKLAGTSIEKCSFEGLFFFIEVEKVDVTFIVCF